MPTGVGTAAAAAATAAGATAATAAAVAAAATLAAQIALSLAVSFVLGAVSRALTKKPKTPGGELRDRTLTIRQAASPWRIPYGESRIPGVITFAQSTNQNNGLHQIITLAGCEIQGIVDVLFDDGVVPYPTGGGEVLSSHSALGGLVRIEQRLGTSSQIAYELFGLSGSDVSKLTTSHRSRGRASLYILLRWDPNRWLSGIPNITAVVRGRNEIYDPRTGLTGYTNNPALCVADYLTNGAFGLAAVYAGEIDEPALIAAANICDEMVSVTEEGHGFTLDGEVTSVTVTDTGTGPDFLADGVYHNVSLRGGAGTGARGRVTVAGNLITGITVTEGGSGYSGDFQITALIGTQPDWTAMTATAHVSVSSGGNVKLGTPGAMRTGDKVQVSSTGTLPTGLAAATDYYAIRWPARASGDHTIKLATSLANARAGTTISISSMGSGLHTIIRKAEPRYTMDGSFTTDQKPKEILEEMLTAMAGKLVFTGGKWRITAGAYTAPTVTLDEDDLRGGLKITTRISRREGFNAIKGVYSGRNSNWQPTDVPPLFSSAYLAEDNNERVIKDASFPYTGSSSMAQRLMKIDLLKARQPITVAAPCKLSAYQVQAGETVSFTNARMGWSGKAFDVESASPVLVQEGDGPYLGVDLLLRETAATIYAWSTSEESTVDAAPNTNLPNPFDVLAPGAPSVSESLYETRDGAGVRAKATLTWTASADAFVRYYQPEYKLSSASSWTVLSLVQSTTTEILDIAPGIYDFRVKAINDLGSESDYSTATRREIFGLGAKPSAPTGMSISAIANMALIRWTQSADLDVRQGGEVQFRHSPAMSGATWQDSSSIGEALPGSDTVAVLSLMAGTYLMRFVDSSGIASDAASVSTKQATVLAYTNLSTITESTTFPGSHSGTIAIDGLLKLDGVSLMDSWGAVDGLASWDVVGGVATSGIYTFSGSFDFGSVVRKRLTRAMTVQVVNENDLVDSRTASIDDWQDFDGTTNAASADAQVWVRHTDDDPAGSPTWTAWQRLDSAEFLARAFQFQCRLSSSDPAYNIHVSALSVTADNL